MLCFVFCEVQVALVNREDALARFTGSKAASGFGKFEFIERSVGPWFYLFQMLLSR